MGYITICIRLPLLIQNLKLQKTQRSYHIRYQYPVRREKHWSSCIMWKYTKLHHVRNIYSITKYGTNIDYDDMKYLCQVHTRYKVYKMCLVYTDTYYLSDKSDCVIYKLIKPLRSVTSQYSSRWSPPISSQRLRHALLLKSLPPARIT